MLRFPSHPILRPFVFNRRSLSTSIPSLSPLALSASTVLPNYTSSPSSPPRTRDRARYKPEWTTPDLAPSYYFLPPGNFSSDPPVPHLSKKVLQRLFVDKKLSILEVIEALKRSSGSTEEDLKGWNLKLIPIEDDRRPGVLPRMPSSRLVQACPEYRAVLRKLIDTPAVVQYLTDKIAADRKEKEGLTTSRGVLGRKIERDCYRHLQKFVAKRRWVDRVGWEELEDDMLEEARRYVVAEVRHVNETRDLIGTRTLKKTKMTTDDVPIFRPRFNRSAYLPREGESDLRSMPRMLHHLIEYVSNHPEDVKARESLTRDIEKGFIWLKIRDGADEYIQSWLAKRRWDDGASWGELERDMHSVASSFVADEVRKVNESWSTSDDAEPIQVDNVPLFRPVPFGSKRLSGRANVFDPENDKPSQRLRILYHLSLYVYHNPSPKARASLAADIHAHTLELEDKEPADEQSRIFASDRPELKRWLMGNQLQQRTLADGEIRRKRDPRNGFRSAEEIVHDILRFYRRTVRPRISGDDKKRRSAEQSVADALAACKARTYERTVTRIGKSLAPKTILVYNMTPERLAKRKMMWWALARKRKLARDQRSKDDVPAWAEKLRRIESRDKG